MKKLLVVLTFLFSISLLSSFAENSITDVLKEFDEILMDGQNIRAQMTIGFITYEDSNTCGSVVPYFQKEIREAAENTRRINIVKTTELTEYEQAGIATRGVNMGMSKKAKTNKNPAYNLDGVYYDRGNNIELVLTMHNADGKVFAKKSAFISKSVISEKKLTLYPENKRLAESIQTDFDSSEKEMESERSKKNGNSSDNSKVGESAKIGIAASMLDAGGSLVNMLYPNDKVSFKISVDKDCYLAILCIDANGAKTWLPMTNNFIEADKVRLFPDIPGAVLRVADDGVFGAEQVIIYACSKKEGLPSQTDGGKYSNSDLHTIMRRQKSVRNYGDLDSGTFKITYTILKK